MKFACEECGARYQIADEKISPRGVKVRCKKCGHINRIMPAAEPDPEPATQTESESPAVSAPSLESEPSALGSGELPEFGTHELPDFSASAPDPDEEATVDDGQAAVDSESSSKPEASSEPDPQPESFREGDPDAPSAELSSLQDSLQAEFDDGPVALPPAPSSLGASEVEDALASQSPAEPYQEPRASTADLNTEVGIESEIGSAFAAMFSAEGLASDHAPFPEPEALAGPAEVPDSAPSIPVDAEWYVAVRDEQLGPLTQAEIEQYWADKRLGAQSLCWKQGMGDWLPMVSVPEFQDLPGMDTAAGGDEDASYEGLPNLRPPSELIPSPAARAPSEADWKPSAASALASLAAEEMADAPNEEAPIALESSDVAASSPSAAEALLAAAVAPSTGGPPAAATATGPLPITSIPASVPASLPAAAPVRPGTPSWVWAAAAVLVLAVVGGGGAYFLLQGSGGGASGPSAPLAVVRPDLGAPEPEDMGAKPALDPTTGPVDMGAIPEPGPADAGSAVETEQEAPERVAPPPRPKTTRRRTRKPTRTTRPPASTPSNTTTDVDDLLGGAKAPGGGSNALPRVPDDGDVFNAIRRHGGEVRGCVAQQMREDPSLKGRMQVKLRIAGTGKVMSVSVSPAQFRDAPVGRCMQRSAKSWRFPRFSGPPFPVEFPVPVQ
ncbi:MAG: AgmX/PglI C-terminal domain-containing protein [Myxococcota bacterium]